MKTEELMIGDWVQYQYTGGVFQIVEISKTEGIKQFEDQPFFKLNGIIPIPLTPEILEKNGFYRSEIPTRDEIGHYYHRKTAPSNIFVSMSFDDGRDFGNEIKYVHQLQHALKLCGIEKEIVV